MADQPGTAPPQPAPGRPAPGAGRARGLSIQQKLPLLIGGLLLTMMVAYTWLSYRAVKDGALEVGRQRLVSLTDQLGKLYEQSAKEFGKSTRAVAADSNVVAVLKTGSMRARDEAIAMLRKAGPRPENTIRTELLDASRTPVLTLPEGGTERHEELEPDLRRAATGPDHAAVGRLRLLNDTLVVPAIAAVLDGDKAIGYLVRWRRISGSEKAREQLSKLLGANAGLYLGNDRGDLWTDLVGVAAKPPVDIHVAPGQVKQYKRPGNGDVVAASMAVPGTPWVALVEFSRDAVLAPADQSLRRALIVGLVVLIAGALAAWMLSRSITQPLTELTTAAAAMAAGNFSQAIHSGRSDELGQLSKAFNTMVARVGEARQGLEQKVSDRTSELQERNEELEAFAHSISHDLRAPLRAMHGFSQALLEDYGPTLDPAARDYAERVVGGAQRMDALIQDLLSYSRVSRAQMELVAVNLNDAATEALGQLEADVSASHGMVSVAESLPLVQAHRTTLVQVVVNLVSNALKFVPPGRTPEIRLRAEKSSRITRLWVEDNGIGIDSSHHERVFGVFERLHRNEDYPGTGIGLAIVRKGVERMGGRVGVVSSLGHGSQFWIELRSAGAPA